MTQQTQDRTTALRELLVELPSRTRPGLRPAGRLPMIVATAAIGAVAIGTVLTTAQLSAPKSADVNPPVTSDPIAGPSTGSGSRVRMYASLDELIADSGAIILGSVTEQHPGPDGTTVSTIAVERSFTPPDLGKTSLEPPVDVVAGNSISVRTFGGMTSSLPAASLTPGARYLLFLSPTGLPSAGDDEFFVTGVVAGIYEAKADRYLRASNDGDLLPEEIGGEDLR